MRSQWVVIGNVNASEFVVNSEMISQHLATQLLNYSNRTIWPGTVRLIRMAPVYH